MICPKCKGEVLDIRGEYYCSQCGEKIDLNEVKQEIETEMQEAKTKTEEHVSGQDSPYPASQEISSSYGSNSQESLPPSYNGMPQVPPATVQNQNSQPPVSPAPNIAEPNNTVAEPSMEKNQDIASPEVSSMDKQFSSTQPIDNKPQVQPSPSPQIKPIIPNHSQPESSNNIKILLMTIMGLNILVLLLMIIFFIIK